MLQKMLVPVLSLDSGRVGLFLGRGAKGFLEDFLMRYPDLHDRIHARSDLPAAEVASHLAACDLLLQPYLDGVSSRRTSVMAGLALGKAIVTTHGPATEKVWRDQLLVACAESDSEAAVEQLLAGPSARCTLGERARLGYERHFSMRRTIDILRNSA